ASTPAFVVGVRPGLSWLQLRLHYTASIYKLELPTNGKKSSVGFANFDALLSRELRVAGERMIVLGGFSGGFVHTSQGIGPAFGSVLAAHYMIDVSPSIALGPFFDFRWQLYRLPKSDEPFYRRENGRLRTGHSDAQSQIGVALSFR
ncbi:MAG TPA: hypothetical protein VMF89_21115, partial [Polyangiales bacterium]|nr:hypothetical protein [Polyangiales bacterium]